MNGTANKDQDDEHKIKFMDWGFNIDRLFEVAYRFYKRNESKAFHPSFDVRNQMNALILQVRYGDYDNGRAPDIGVLDFVGKRRQYEWTLLKGMSKTEAMSKFICTLDELCPFFKSHAEAVKISSGFDQNPSDNDYNQIGQNANTLGKSSEADEQLKTIYSSLCRQTQKQFKNYAEKQYPNELVQQKKLIKSLQERYFQQYISQMHPELKDSLVISTSNSGNNAQQSNIPSSIPSPTVSEKSQINTTPDLNSSSDVTTNATRVPNNVVDIVDGSVSNLLVVQLESINMNATTAESNSNKFNMVEAQNTATELNVSTIEADISCEELNTADIATTVPEDNVMNNLKMENSLLSHNAQPSSQKTTTVNLTITPQPQLPPLQIETTKSSPKSPSLNAATPSPNSSSNTSKPHQSQSSPSNHIEHVRLYQHTDLPPIGSFESFPKPKPIQSTNQTPCSPIAELNPNLTRPVKPPTLEFTQPTIEDTATATTSLPEESREKSQKLSLDECEYPAENHYHHQPEPWGCVDSESSDCASPVVDDNILDGDDDEDNIVDQQDEQLMHSGGDSYELASTWSKKGVAEFKDSLNNDKYGGVYEIKEGTMVVIQVPTYPDGRFIYLEFATDDYDIAFGLDFVFEMNLLQPLAINIYEESDDDEDDDDDDVVGGVENDIVEQHHQANSNHYNIDLEATGNCGQTGQHQIETDRTNAAAKKITAKARRAANTISIVPTYRRDSHEEVFVGRHRYPGKGYYLLKFDNTYSVLRSKTLYFRICYFI